MNSAERVASYFTGCRPAFERKILLKQGQRLPQRRAPQGKRLIIRGNSMLPQFKIAPEVLQSLWATSRGQTLKRRLVGVLAGRKSSPQHYLSIRITDLFMAGRSESGLAEDYQIRLLAGLDTILSADLENEFAKADKKIDSLETKIEPLHLCRAVCGFDVDTKSHKVVLKAYLVYPSVSLQFTPVEAIPIPAWDADAGFALGFLVQDSPGRVLAVSRKEASLSKKPLLGLWANGVPAGNQPSEYPFLHPLVWAAAVQFLQTKRDRVTSGGRKPSFLFVYQARHWYEVTACVPATQSEDSLGWQTAVVSKSVAVDSPALLTFFPDDLVEDESTCSSSAFSTPVRHVSNLPSWDASSVSFDRKADIDSETKIRLLELQVHELQRQLKSATQSLCVTPALSPKGGAKTARVRREEMGKWRTSALNRSGVLFRVDEFDEVAIDRPPRRPTPKTTTHTRCVPGVAASPPSQKDCKPGYFLFPEQTDMRQSTEVFAEPDTSYQIPTISYESDNSSEDDSFSLSAIQQKYLI